MAGDAPYVLAVDDSLVDRTLIERLLRISSCRVTTVDSGIRALQFLGLDGEHKPSLKVNMIITDYCMPGMNGFELLKKIKESSALREIPVVIMSSENVVARIDRYTLWNAEYRVSLTRNFIITHGHELESHEDMFDDELNDGVRIHSGHSEINSQELGMPSSVTKLSQEAFNYIENLESELATVEKELDAEKHGQLVNLKNYERNDLLDYLRSLEPEMVTEISHPSSPEVEEIIQKLVENVLQRFFKDDKPSDYAEEGDNFSEDLLGNGSTTGTSRDYLAKLIFWCMLLGHHMRGLEYRLHLSCVVGIF